MKPVGATGFAVLGAGLIAITVGQAVGSPLVGWTISRTGHVEAFMAFAALALLVAALSFLYTQARGEADAEDAAGPQSPAPTAADDPHRTLGHP